MSDLESDRNRLKDKVAELTRQLSEREEELEEAKASAYIVNLQDELTALRAKVGELEKLGRENELLMLAANTTLQRLTGEKRDLESELALARRGLPEGVLGLCREELEICWGALVEEARSISYGIGAGTVDSPSALERINVANKLRAIIATGTLDLAKLLRDSEAMDVLRASRIVKPNNIDYLEVTTDGKWYVETVDDRTFIDTDPAEAILTAAKGEQHDTTAGEGER